METASHLLFVFGLGVFVVIIYRLGLFIAEHLTVLAFKRFFKRVMIYISKRIA